MTDTNMTTSMNPEVKTLFVEALRSDRFEQGRRMLCRDGKYCVLGVLCELAVENGIIEKSGQYTKTYSNNYKYSLPPKVAKWAGVNHYKDANIPVFLSGLNDVGKTFSELADIIEEHF